MPKTCSKCSHVKPDEDFRDRANQCKQCRAEYTRNWQLANKDKVYYNLCRYRYGMTPEAVTQLIADQNGLCAICQQPPTMKGPRGQRLFIDHCHTSGKIRGAICNDCNLALGRAKDNVQILRSMITYLESNG